MDKAIGLPSAVQAQSAGPCAMVIFGAAGDLTKRLVVPALYNLAVGRLLPENFALIGVDAADITTDQWRQHLSGMMHSFLGGEGEFKPISIDNGIWNALLARMSYLKGDFGQDRTFAQLDTMLEQAEKDHRTGGNALFYLAVPDRFFGPFTLAQVLSVAVISIGAWLAFRAGRITAAKASA